MRVHREAAFLALGPGAAPWLIEAAAGTRRIRPKMAEAVTLAKLYSPGEVDRALGIAAMAGRFADNDLIAILTYGLGRQAAEPIRTSESVILFRVDGGRQAELRL